MKGKQFISLHMLVCCLFLKLALFTSLRFVYDALSTVENGLLASSDLLKDLLPQKLPAQENLCL